MAAGTGPAVASAAAASPTRRERQRQATYDEIVEVARRLLRSSSGDLSLRAVATEMGMTPPALYRYVDSYAELLELVARSIFIDVVEAMRVARDRHPDDDPAAQIVAASAAFRAWALGNHAEFRLVFASPLPDEGSADAGTAPAVVPPRVDSLAACPPGNGADMFAAFFSEIFGRLWGKYQFHIPTDDELDPAVLAVLRDQLPPAKVIGAEGTVAPGMVWMFERAWAALYGTVTLEVFGHIHPEFISSGALFRATLLDLGRSLGLEPEWDRLSKIVTTDPA